MHFLIFPFLIGLFGILAMKKTASFSTCCLPNFPCHLSKGHFSRAKNERFSRRKAPVFLPSNHNWSVFLLRKNGFAAGFLSGTHCGFTLILRLRTTTCHQYHRFHMCRVFNQNLRFTQLLLGVRITVCTMSKTKQF